VVLGLCQLALAWPAPSFWDGQESFQRIVGHTGRIIVGSLVAYIVSQLHDIRAFAFWKRMTRGRHLWLRNNLSTAVSQLADTTIFYGIAFYGIIPDDQLPLVA